MDAVSPAERCSSEYSSTPVESILAPYIWPAPVSHYPDISGNLSIVVVTEQSRGDMSAEKIKEA